MLWFKSKMSPKVPYFWKVIGSCGGYAHQCSCHLLIHSWVITGRRLQSFDLNVLPRDKFQTICMTSKELQACNQKSKWKAVIEEHQDLYSRKKMWHTAWLKGKSITHGPEHTPQSDRRPQISQFRILRVCTGISWLTVFCVISGGLKTCACLKNSFWM